MPPFEKKIYDPGIFRGAAFTCSYIYARSEKHGVFNRPASSMADLMSRPVIDKLLASLCHCVCVCVEKVGRAAIQGRKGSIQALFKGFCHTPNNPGIGCGSRLCVVHMLWLVLFLSYHQ